MFRCFVTEINFNTKTAIITGDDVKHLKNTLRYKVDDEIILIHNGIEYQGVIIELYHDRILCKINDVIENKTEPSTNIVLFQGLPKKSKMELIVQQNVEIGVTQIVPVVTKRTIVKINEENKENKKIERWKKISRESAKQSRRQIIPQIENIISFKKMIEVLNNSNKEIIVPFENEKTTTIKEVINKTINEYAIVIGPEGGFDDNEIEALYKIGAHIVTLGPRILRTETAGLVVSAIILHEMDDLK